MNIPVCFLVINSIRDLPEIAISSVLAQTSADIKVGYLREADIKSLPKNSRIELINLGPLIDDSEREISVPGDTYIPYDREDFFDLVRIKWKLFSKILQEHDGLIYSDVDVIWLQDLHRIIRKTFEDESNIEVLVQDASTLPNRAQLCMGLFACRTSNFSLELITECDALHHAGRTRRERYSDDNAITDFYSAMSDKSKVGKLPQASFPVGNFLNLFLPVSLFRGLRPPKPFIFHANYVVGVPKKVALIRFIQFNYNVNIRNLLLFLRSYTIALGFFLLKVGTLIRKNQQLKEKS